MKSEKYLMSVCLRRTISSAIFFLVVVIAITSCTPKMNGAYIEEAVKESGGTLAVQADGAKQVRYFFDRTDSMRGFTQNGVETEYAKALDSVWTLAEKAWGSLISQEYFEFGEEATAKLNFDTVLKEVRLPDFYGYRNVKGEKVKDNNKQPFRSVVEYVRAENISENILNIVITDLYEQNGAHQYFHLLFQTAFEKGMSGALFAVESTFKGNINDINPVDLSASIKVNGYSTFFIFLTGDTKSVKEYSARLQTEFVNKELKFNTSLFIIGDTAKNYLYLPKEKMAGREKLFNSQDYQYSIVNLRRTHLRKWQTILTKHDTVTYKQMPSDEEAYNIMTKLGARYVAGIPVGKFDESEFEYSSSINVEYFDGSKTARGEASKFLQYSKPLANIVTGSVLSGDKIPATLRESAITDNGNEYVYIILETKNMNMNKGYYKIEYKITPAASVPKWVQERSAATIANLMQSNLPDALIRVLNLKLIYADIDNEYNKLQDRFAYSNVIYLVKNK